MHITADVLVAALREQGFRITTARRAVCEVVAEAHAEHLTAADVVARTGQRGGARPDRSTVYRTLRALEAAGLVSHSHLGHGPSVYHLAEEAAHEHLICSGCGRTFTLPDGAVRRIQETITEATGFVPDPGHFALPGRCADCAVGAS